MKVTQSCPTLCDPMDYTVHGILWARIVAWVAFPSPRGSSQPRSEPRSPALQADSLPAEPPWKPKNTGVGKLSVLQWISPTQGSNSGPLHCRLILYHLSHQGSPRILEWVACPFSRGSFQPRNCTSVSCIAGFPGSSDGKASAYNAGDLGSIPGSGRSPGEKEMATHSSTLAWRILWVEEPGGLQSMGSLRVIHD